MSSFNKDSLSGLSVKASTCPDNIIVVGGGRWARVLIKTICDLVDRSVNILIYSRSNAQFMREWVKSEKMDHKIQVFSILPEKFPTSNAVIVVNAARDHAQTARQALLAGGSVMVEKPFTLSYSESKDLVGFSKKIGGELFAAHIFLFSRYFEKFSELVANAGTVTSINVHWIDPQSEDRYGESKQYDSGLPVFADWLPHILPMISTLLPGKYQSCRTLDIKKGGASVYIHLIINEVPCQIVLERDSDCRKRMMEVFCVDKKLSLDFSSEPGTITDGMDRINGDPNWQQGLKPSALMLDAFFRGASGTNYDKRLDVSLGLNSTSIVDQCAKLYIIKQLEWLVEQIENGNKLNNSLGINYALREIFQSEGSLSNEEIANRIERFGKVLTSDSRESWIEELRYNKNQKSIMNMGSM